MPFLVRLRALRAVSRPATTNFELDQLAKAPSGWKCSKPDLRLPSSASQRVRLVESARFQGAVSPREQPGRQRVALRSVNAASRRADGVSQGEAVASQGADQGATVEKATKKYFILDYDYVYGILEKRAPHRPGHLALCTELAEKGDLLLGGARQEPLDGAWLLFHVQDSQVIQDFISKDPYVKAGLVTSHRIRPWAVVVGSSLADSAAASGPKPQEESSSLENRVVSMSGFARGEGIRGGTSWTWEAKSVNGKSLNVSARLPASYSALEPSLTSAAAERFARGSVYISLEVKADKAKGEGRLAINQEALKQLMTDLWKFRMGLVWGPEYYVQLDLDAMGHFPVRELVKLLPIHGIVQYEDLTQSEEENDATKAAILKSLGGVLDDLAASRAAEGARLAAILAAHVAELADLAAQAEAAAKDRLPLAKEKIRQTAAELLEVVAELDPGRLEQELAFQAARMDVREEVERLKSHVTGLRELLGGKGRQSKRSGDEEGARRGLVIGRRLDFLAQELNREANTLAAKSNDVGLTQVALHLKAVIDQLKEQAANVQ